MDSVPGWTGAGSPDSHPGGGLPISPNRTPHWPGSPCRHMTHCTNTCELRLRLSIVHRVPGWGGRRAGQRTGRTALAGCSARPSAGPRPCHRNSGPAEAHSAFVGPAGSGPPVRRPAEPVLKPWRSEPVPSVKHCNTPMDARTGRRGRPAGTAGPPARLHRPVRGPARPQPERAWPAPPRAAGRAPTVRTAELARRAPAGRPAG